MSASTGTAGLWKLPFEVRFKVMRLFDDPSTVLSLVLACPVFWKIYKEYRAHITRCLVLENLSQRLHDSLVPIAMLAVRARYIHERYGHLGAAAVRQKMARIAAFSLSVDYEGISWPTNLAALSAISNLLEEVDQFVFEYASSAWSRIQQVILYDPRLYRLWQSGQFANAPLLLSNSERLRHQHAVLHFEAYCKLFFFEGICLFQNEAMHMEFLDKVSHQNPCRRFNLILNDVSIIFDYVCSRHIEILDAVTTGLGLGRAQPFPCKADYLHSATEQVRVHYNLVAQLLGAIEADSTAIKTAMRMVKLRTRTVAHERAYILDLCMQGIRPLLQLRRMDSIYHRDYTLDRFFHVSTRGDSELWNCLDFGVDHESHIVFMWPGNSFSFAQPDLDHRFLDPGRVLEFQAIVRYSMRG